MAVPSVRGRSVERVAEQRLPLIAFGILVLVLAVTRWPNAVSSTIALPAVSASVLGEVGPLPVLLGLAASGGRDRDTDLERLATDLESFVSAHCPAESDGESSEGTGRFDLERDDEVGRLATAIDELARTCAAREERLAERERELRRHERRFEAVFDDPKMLGALLEPDGTVRSVNETAFDYVDVDRNSVIGEPFEETPWWADTAASDIRNWIDRAAAGEYVEYRAHLDGPDGTRAWVTGTFRPVTAEDGDVVSIIVSAHDITEQQERERRLETTAARLEALYEHSPDMIDVLDEEGTILDANSRFCDQLGYAKEELLGTKIWRYDQQVDAEEVLTLLEEMAVGERRRFEGRYRRADGSTFPIEIHLIRLDIDGENRYVVISRDISEQDERERKLRARERELQRYKAYTDDVLDAIDDVFYVFDRDGNLQRWNETLAAVTGYTNEEIASMNAPEFFEGTEQVVIADAIEEVFDAGELRVEAQITTADGDQIPYEFVATRLEDLEGNSVIAGIGRDISERRAKERELERYRAFTDDMLDAVDDIFYVLGADGEMLRWNESVAAVSGYTDEEIASMNAVDFFPEDEQPAIRRSVEEAFETGTTQVEAEYLTKDGERIPYEFVATVLENPDGRPVEVGIGRDISDRKERETELRERERELSTLMSNVPGMVYRCENTANWPFEFISEGSAELTGYDPEALVDGDVNWGDDVLCEDHDELWETVQEALADRDSFQVTYPIETADGERRWLSERGRGIYGADDSVEALEGVITDVTDRIENERELERTTRLLEQAEQLANVGAWVIDVRSEPNDLQWTDEVARIHGLSPDAEIDLEAAIEYYHPEDRATVRRAIERAVDAGEPYDLELRLVPDDDSGTRWVRTIGDPVRENGEVAKIYGSFQDITERKQRERELERYETIIQAIGDPVYTLDASGDFRFINDAIESLTGYDPETMIGAPVTEFMQPPDLERARELVRELLRKGEPYETFEMTLETADGGTIDAENHVALLPTEDGEFAGTAGVVRDITERKERERDLERTTELLAQAQRIAGVGGWELDVTTDPYDLTVTDDLQRLFRQSESTDPKRDVSDAIRTYHPEDRPRVLEAVDAAIEEGESYDLEVRMFTADGEERWMRTIGEPVFGDDGEVVAVRGSVQDISDRKERERHLERTTDLLERVQRLAAVGGWELDVRTEPPEATWTDEMYRLHDLPESVTPTLETTLDCYHPDDRPFVRQRLERAVETETGYDLEGRLLLGDGEYRWVRAIGEPIFDDGSLIKYRGAVEDISDRKRRELTLESLHETARELLNAEAESAVAELVVETAVDLLDSGSAAVYLLDSETNRFEPAASSAEFLERDIGPPSVPVGDSDSVLWNSYVTGSQTVVDDADIGDRSPLFGGDAPGGLLVPIGDHGVFVLVASPETLDDETRQLFETLVATTEAAFDRLESEATLRERDAELEAQNKRLRRQIQLTEIIRGIDRSLIGAGSRADIERTVTDRLVEADPISFAWIGDLDASGTALESRAWAGTAPGYLDALSLELEGESAEPSVQTARSETPTVIENAVEGLQTEPWRTNALDAGFQSVVSVPLVFEEYSYGVLSVYADEPDAFTDLERTVFAELGEGIANAINATQTREALHAETLVELTLSLEADDDILSRLARATGGTVTYEGLGTHSRSETVLFFECSGVDPSEVQAALDGFVSVTSSRLISESEDACLFEATVTGDVAASRLVRHGGSPRSIRATGTRTEITVDVPTSTDVREYVEMLAEQYAAVDLQSRQHVQRAMQTRQELITSLFADLTDRQLEVLRTAYLAGFFEWPRESTGEEIADMLEVTQPTVNRHLRIGQQRLLAQLFENGALSIANES